MTQAKLGGGSYIKIDRPLMVARECLVDPADDNMIDAGNDGWITHAAPGTTSFWVLDSVQVGFDLMPTGSFRLEIWYNVGAGNVVVFDGYVGAPPAANGTDVNTMGTIEMNGPVSRRFPDDAQMRVTLYSGDVLVASSLNIISKVSTHV